MIKKTEILIGQANKIDFLIKNGFENIGNIKQFIKNGLPDKQNLRFCGVYAISIPNGYIPKFITPTLAKYTGNVINPWPISELENKWVKNSEIVYYGLAGQKSFRTLEERLSELIKHVKGKTTDRGPHKGGEIVWQLENYQEFNVWIKPTKEPPEPVHIKKIILKKFYSENGKLPFANRRL